MSVHFTTLRRVNRQTKLLNKTKKGFLFLSETHPSHRKHIRITGNTFQPPSLMSMHQLSHRTNINRFNLFGAIVLLMFHLSWTIRVHIETNSINWFSKLIKWFLYHLQKHRKKWNLNVTVQRRIYNTGHDILELCAIFPYRLDSSQVRRNLVYELHQELPNNVRLRILGN